MSYPPRYSIFPTLPPRGSSIPARASSIPALLPLALAGCLAPTSPQRVSEAEPARTTFPPPPDDGYVPVDNTLFCPTSGKVDAIDANAMKVTSGELRGVVPGDYGRAAEVVFRYHGPSLGDTPLANGEMRRQIGLKLRAQDTCNVVYVMWHIEPTPGVFVSVKSNPGQSTHAECGANGYINLKSTLSGGAPLIFQGDTHTLRAELDDTTLSVFADGVLVFRAPLPPEAFFFDGPVGMRSDNGDFDFEMRAPDTDPGAQIAVGCEGTPSTPD
jgi:hypothetical protein